MRFVLRRVESLRACAVHVRLDVMRAPANLGPKATVPSAPRTDVRLAAVHGKRQAGEVCESRGLTVAHHPEER